MEKTKITYEDINKDIRELASQINSEEFDSIYAIPRGGVPIGIALSFLLGLPLVEEAGENSLIVDDLIDGGKTLETFKQKKAVLYRKPNSPQVDYFVKELDGWIEFPYENTDIDIEGNIRRVLEYVGEDSTREGLRDTPMRYIKFLKQFLEKEPFKFTVFNSEGYDQMIIQRDIPYYSMCEHHLAPFFGVATIAYIPNDKIIGLSKLARTLRHYASNLQNQERITSQVAERLQKELEPKGVAVSITGTHLCMEMRGVKTHGTSTRTTKLIGAFLDSKESRDEFLREITK